MPMIRLVKRGQAAAAANINTTTTTTTTTDSSDDGSAMASDKQLSSGVICLVSPRSDTNGPIVRIEPRYPTEDVVLLSLADPSLSSSEASSPVTSGSKRKRDDDEDLDVPVSKKRIIIIGRRAKAIEEREAAAHWRNTYKVAVEATALIAALQMLAAKDGGASTNCPGTPAPRVSRDAAPMTPLAHVGEVRMRNLTPLPARRSR